MGINLEAVAFAVVVVAVVWLFMGQIWSQLSGWKMLAEAYPDRPEAALTKVWEPGGQIGCVSSKYVFLRSCKTGLRIQPARWLVLQAKAALIPWSDIQAQAVEPKYFGWMYPVVKLTFRLEPEPRLLIQPPYLDQLAGAAGIKIDVQPPPP